MALPREAYDAIAKAGTGQGINYFVPGSKGLGRNDAGRVAINRYSGQPLSVAVSSKLSPSMTERVSAHEIGHVIDQSINELSTDGIKRELSQIYNTLNTGRERSTNLTGPQHFGYSEKDSTRELMAEAIRAYMADPNYIKTVAPKTAERIRRVVNTNPALNKTIQFNSMIPLSALGVGTLISPEQADY